MECLPLDVLPVVVRLERAGLVDAEIFALII